MHKLQRILFLWLIMEKRKWTTEEKQEIVRRCDSAKENGEQIKDILIEYGAKSSQLCMWRKKYRIEKIDCPSEILEEFEGAEIEQDEPEPDIQENGCFKADDPQQRGTIAAYLFMSGYVIWQTVKDGHYFINFEKGEKT